MDMTHEPRQAELWSFAGSPVNGPAGTFHQHASIGDLFVDTIAKRLYVCTEVLQSSGFTGPGQDHLQGAAASITWEPLQ